MDADPRKDVPRRVCVCLCVALGGRGPRERVGGKEGQKERTRCGGMEEGASRSLTREQRSEGGGRAGDTEGTCYALRDMAEACGIHNFVKTKMLRSCLGGVAFFLVSRNVQPRRSSLHTPPAAHSPLFRSWPAPCPGCFPRASSLRSFL